MQYKTIALELIQDNPELYEQLRSTKRLMPTMDAYATDLKTSHETWKEQLTRSRPHGDPTQIAAEAMELAIEEIRRSLSASEASDAEPLSLDAAMSYIRKTSQPA